MSARDKNGLAHVSHVDQQLGRRLKELREQAGISREQFAVDLGVSAASLTRYESGHIRCPASVLWLAAQSLGVSVAVFFEGLEP